MCIAREHVHSEGTCAQPRTMCTIMELGIVSCIVKELVHSQLHSKETSAYSRNMCKVRDHGHCQGILCMVNFIVNELVHCQLYSQGKCA